MNSDAEIRPSLRFKYIVLIALTAGISSGIGYFVSEYLGSQNHILTVTKFASSNKINRDINKTDPLRIAYSLRNDPDAEISGYDTLYFSLASIEDVSIE